jgi:dihydrofolate synthase/folylpolyglutamate synthase
LIELLRARGIQIAAELFPALQIIFHLGDELIHFFDGAHNPAAARALRNYLDEFVTAPVTMIFGAMKDKRLQEMAGLLFPKANELILTEIDNKRAASLQDLLAAVPADFSRARLSTASNVGDALAKARELTPDDGLICITGSLYLIGAAQQRLCC